MGNDQQGARELALGRYLNGPGSAFGAFEQGFDAGYSAGAEDMRERAATECRMLHAIHTRESGREPDCAGLISNLPVGESSRAPEGTRK